MPIYAEALDQSESNFAIIAIFILEVTNEQVMVCGFG